MIEAIAEDHVMSRALRYYEDELKTVLEPARNGEYIVIDPDREDYAISTDPIRAYEELFARGSEPPLPLLRIGHEATFEYL
jgi:hypothetical protein